MDTSCGARVGAYLGSCRARGLSPHTLELYQWGLRPLKDGAISGPADLEDVMAELSGRPETKRGYFRIWRAFYRWAARRYHVANPMAELSAPRRRPEALRALSEGEVGLLLGAARGRELPLAALLLDTGIRLGEAEGLTLADVGADLVNVNGKTGPRAVPITPWVRELLLPVLPWGVTARTLRSDVKQALARAGVTGPRTSPHMLRHTFATLYLGGGGDLVSLQAILGHRDMATTTGYIHLALDHARRQHRRFSPLRAGLSALPSGHEAPGLAPSVVREVEGLLEGFLGV